MSAEQIKRKTLGRGLNALFGEQDDTPDAAPAAAPVSKSSDVVAIDLLHPSPLQPRTYFKEEALEELAASIREKGILQPLLVRPDPHDPNKYEIIAGERRWRAAQRARLHTVPVIVREFNDEQVLEVALIENLQRQDLSAVEEGRGYRRLMDEFGHTQEAVAEIVGKSRTHVANTLRLLSLPDHVLKMIDDGKLAAGQARPLVGLKNAEVLAFNIVRKGLSARQAERLAKGHGKTKRTTLTRGEKDADTRALEQTLEDATGYRVDISFDGKGGKVTIDYASLEQLDDIVKRLSNGGKRGRVDDDDRDDNTVDIEELLARDGLKESREHLAADDHDAAYADPSADDTGATGALARELAARGVLVEDPLVPDRGGDAPHATAHQDPAADDVGAEGATHR